MALYITNHPLIQHKLTIMRKRETGTLEFRELLKEIGMLMGYEVCRDFPLKEVEIETPILLTLIPAAKVGHIGMYRDEKTHEPVFYYYKMPDGKDRMVILTDPMLATGGSACDAIKRLKDDGYTHIRMVCLVASPQGVERVQREHPDVDIYTAALDDGLNKDCYILPGLGDAGDRIFGTL